VLIELAKYDPLLDAHPAGDDPLALHNFYWWEADFWSDILSRPIERLSAWREKRRLRRILRAFPNSLHCTACGFTRKRR
jgi:hypothetical protein